MRWSSAFGVNIICDVLLGLLEFKITQINEGAPRIFQHLNIQQLHKLFKKYLNYYTDWVWFQSEIISKLARKAIICVNIKFFCFVLQLL